MFIYICLQMSWCGATLILKYIFNKISTCKSLLANRKEKLTFYFINLFWHLPSCREDRICKKIRNLLESIAIDNIAISIFRFSNKSICRQKTSIILGYSCFYILFQNIIIWQRYRSYIFHYMPTKTCLKRLCSFPVSMF